MRKIVNSTLRFDFTTHSSEGMISIIKGVIDGMQRVQFTGEYHALLMVKP